MEKYKPTERVQKLRAEARKAVETHDMDLRRARRESGLRTKSWTPEGGN